MMNDEKIVMTSSDRNYAIKGYVVGGNFGTGIPWCGEKQFQQLQPLIRVNNQNQPELRIC